MAWVMMAASAVGYVNTAVGQLDEGAAKARDGEVTALTLEQNAKLEQAYGQRRAIEERRQARLVASAAKARLAAEGSTTDGSAAKILTDIHSEGELRALTRMYEGDMTARGDRLKAGAARRGAADALSAAQFAANGTILEGASSLYSKYGPKESYGGGDEYTLNGGEYTPYGYMGRKDTVSVRKAQKQWAAATGYG